ncbi:Galectin-5 [Eumeta japonica]|uniref:Galectin n=1 Tax=Eumeta variegata TaxID=151549 RepID=A0A4C1W068_EUMVA|nr:Galectin-5 [Eumeta japonica]
MQEYTYKNGVQTCEDTVTSAPSVPVFRQDLEAPLAVGSHVVFSGTPADDVQREVNGQLHVNFSNWQARFLLTCRGGHAPSVRRSPRLYPCRVTFNIGAGDDVAVHVDARLPQRCVVRNTRRRGAWGPQETAAFRPFPFASGRPFVVEALVGENDTLWAVDGLHYCEYAHRNPSPLAAAPGSGAAAAPLWLELIGARDVSIDVRRGEEYPKLAPPWPEVPSRRDLEAPASRDEPSWPPNARALLPQGVPPEHQLVVKGRLRALLHSFRVELTTGCQEWPRPDVALHFELRAYFESYRPRQLVVLNSRSDGAWGEERRQRSAAMIPSTNVNYILIVTIA